VEDKSLKIRSPLTGGAAASVRTLLEELPAPFAARGSVGIKLHWGEKGNKSFLPPHMAREIARWLMEKGCVPLFLIPPSFIPAADAPVTIH